MGVRGCALALAVCAQVVLSGCVEDRGASPASAPDQDDVVSVDATESQLVLRYPDSAETARWTRRLVSIDDRSLLISPAIGLSTIDGRGRADQQGRWVLVNFTDDDRVEVVELGDTLPEPGEFLVAETAVRTGDVVAVLGTRCINDLELFSDMPDTWAACDDASTFVAAFDADGSVRWWDDVTEQVPTASTARLLHGNGPGQVGLIVANQPDRLFAGPNNGVVWERSAQGWVPGAALDGLVVDANAVWVCSTADGTRWALRSTRPAETLGRGPAPLAIEVVTLAPGAASWQPLDGTARDEVVAVWLDCGTDMAAAVLDERGVDPDDPNATDGPPLDAPYRLDVLTAAVGDTVARAIEIDTSLSPALYGSAGRLADDGTLLLVPDPLAAPSGDAVDSRPVDLRSGQHVGEPIPAASVGSAGVLAGGRVWIATGGTADTTTLTAVARSHTGTARASGEWSWKERE